MNQDQGMYSLPLNEFSVDLSLHETKIKYKGNITAIILYVCMYVCMYKHIHIYTYVYIPLCINREFKETLLNGENILKGITHLYSKFW